MKMNMNSNRKSHAGPARLASCLLLVLAGIAPLTPQRANAGTQTGTITNLITRDSDGLVYVYLTGSASGRPACAAGTQYWMIPNETSDSGKRMYASLLAAQMASRVVIVTGKNTCTRWGDGEDINAVQTQ
jgi:hypothetical protein